LSESDPPAPSQEPSERQSERHRRRLVWLLVISVLAMLLFHLISSLVLLSTGNSLAVDGMLRVLAIYLPLLTLLLGFYVGRTSS
jgi:hypothetical protein